MLGWGASWFGDCGRQGVVEWGYMKSKYSEKMIDRALIASVLAFVFLGFICGYQLALKNIWISLASIPIMVFIFLLLHRSADKLFAHIQGLKGEFRVNTILSEMWGEGFRYVHDLQLSPKGNIDHVCVGRTGVWVIETKHTNYEIKHSPQLVEGVKQAFAEAATVKTLLAQNGYQVPVMPVLCFSGEFAKVRFGKQKQNGVVVIGYRWLRQTIDDGEAPFALSASQINGIYQILKSKKEADEVDES